MTRGRIHHGVYHMDGISSVHKVYLWKLLKPPTAKTHHMYMEWAKLHPPPSSLSQLITGLYPITPDLKPSLDNKWPFLQYAGGYKLLLVLPGQPYNASFSVLRL
ncbi:UNVERIFIED_CONTAM: hypothetical protein K2H54_038966 [Gekko kuhli]